MDPSTNSTRTCNYNPLSTTANTLVIILFLYTITISILSSFTTAHTAKQDIHNTIIEVDALVRQWNADPCVGGLTPFMRSIEVATAAKAVQDEMKPLRALRVRLGDALKEKGVLARLRTHWRWAAWGHELRGRTERLKIWRGVYDKGMKGKPWDRCGYCGSG